MTAGKQHQQLNAREQVALDRYVLLSPFIRGVASMRQLSRDSGVPERTLWSWLQTFNQSGLAAFNRKTRSDKGVAKELDSSIYRLIEGLALKRPAPTVAYVHRQILNLCKQSGLRCPSYRTVARTVHALEPAVKTMAHEGAKAYGHAYDLIFRREAEYPNEIWQSDHTPLDIFVIDSQGNPVRPWLTTVLDDYSRAIAGYYLALDAPASWKTALALRQAILRKDDPRWHVFGIPKQLYTDHGSDYTSKRIELLAADLHIELVNSQVGEPRGRGKVERLFRTINELFLCSMPGFAPDGEKPPGALMTFEQLETRLREWVIADYMSRHHSEIQMSPQARWEAEDFIPRMIDCPEVLDVLLCTAATQRKVHPDGVRFYDLRYMDVNLAGYVGQQVTVRYDPRDLAEIRLYFKDEFICRAVCQEIAGQTVSLKAIVKARNKERHRVREKIKESAQFLTDYLEIHAEHHSSTEKAAKSTTSLKRYQCD